MKTKILLEVPEETLLAFLFSRYKKEELEKRGIFPENTTVQHVGYAEDANNLQFHLVCNTMEVLLKLKGQVDKVKSMEASSANKVRLKVLRDK